MGLVVKKGSNMLVDDVGGMPWPSSATSIHTALALAAGAHGDGATASVGHGLGGVHKEVHEHLVELGRQAFHQGQLAILAHHVGPYLISLLAMLRVLSSP
jgi:hypothetical protein